MSERIPPDQLPAHFARIVATRTYQRLYRRLNPLARWRLYTALLGAITVYGLVITVYQLVAAVREVLRRDRRYAELPERILRTVPVTVVPFLIDVAKMRRRDGITRGLVLGSFDPEVEPAFLDQVAQRLEPLDVDEPITNEQRVVSGIFNETDHVPDRRRRIPPTLTDGREVVVFDLDVVNAFLPPGFREFPAFVCLAEPGPSGGIWFVPQT